MRIKREFLSFICGAVVFLFLTTAYSQATVNITGQVVDRNGTGIEGASVTLLGESMTTTTDADGNYTISGATGVIGTFGSEKSISGAVLKNGKIMFNVQDNSTPVKIGLYNMTGRNVLDIPQKIYTRGNYSVDLFDKNLASQIYFLRVRIGNASSIFKVPMFDNRPEALNMISKSGRSTNRAPLTKTAEYLIDTTIDSVTVQKDGYSRGSKPILSFECEKDFIVVDTAWFWGDRDAIPQANNVMIYVFLNRTKNYSDSEVFWQEPGTNTWHSIAEQPYFDMGVGSSGRLNFSVGEAGGDYWDFEEHTISSDFWNGNTTRVDCWRLPFAIRLHCEDGYDKMLGERYHLFYLERDTVFQMFKDAVPDEFDHCADNGYPYRIIAPGKGDGKFGSGEELEDYMDPYLAELGITTATTNEVFACAGDPFGGNAQLAGAVNRHVAHLTEEEWLDPDLYYEEAPANFYAKFWHDHSFEHLAYGFAYDDAADQQAFTSHADPEYLIMAIGD